MDEFAVAVAVGVELVHWPRDQVLRDRLARAGIPRLLLVAADSDLPLSIGVDEDWVRLPADERDVWARADRLRRHTLGLQGERPLIDANRVLHRGGDTVVLSASEAIVAAALLERVGEVVARDDLSTKLASGGDQLGSHALDAVVYRLRRRLSGMNLCIRAARNRGFVIFLDDGRR
ncbi:unnamed protein product [Phaeothamnion confervicola]